MSYSHKQSLSLPITLKLEETKITQQCPTCERLDFDGTVTLVVPLASTSGTTPAMCTRKHTVMVTWTRVAEADEQG